MRDRRAHELPPLESTRLPHHVFCLDTEARIATARGLERQSWRLGAVTYDRLDPRRRRVQSQAHFTDPRRLWEWVLERVPAKSRGVVWCHNLSYDLRISAALWWLPSMGYQLDGVVLERTASWASFRGHGRTLLCCDLHSWLPTTLETIASDVGASTKTAWRPDMPPGELLEHCLADVEITRAAVLGLLELLREQNLGPFRPTGAGQSYAAWRRRFLSAPPVVHDDVDQLVRERIAIWAGRCEAWRHGRLERGPYVEYDLEQAYARIASQAQLPGRLAGHTSRSSPAVLDGLARRYCILARVQVDTDTPVLPAAHAGRIIWPAGTFETTVWWPELQAALDECRKVTVLESWLYEPRPCLAEFAGWLLDGVANGGHGAGPVGRRLFKHWGRAITGRVALRYREWELHSRTSTPGLELGTHIDNVNGIKQDYLHVGHDWRVLSELRESDRSLPMLTGWIASECRRRLWDLTHTAGQGEVVYMDTDSLIVTPAGARALEQRIRQDGAYGLRDKARWGALELRGPRNLDLDSSPRVAGVPRKHRRLAPLEFEGEQWSSLKASIATGALDHVTVRKRTYAVPITDPRRVDLGNTHTAPIRLEASNDQAPDLPQPEAAAAPTHA